MYIQSLYTTFYRKSRKKATKKLETGVEKLAKLLWTIYIFSTFSSAEIL